MTEQDQAHADSTQRAARLADSMIATLRAGGDITSREVERAMRTVRRDLFAPEASAEDAYDPYNAVITKRDEYGIAISSVSAAQIQAFQLEQAQVRPGMKVAEVGGGGLNAAYLAELVGPDGSVTSVDIDPDVTDRAERLLGAAGYSRVRVLLGDAEKGFGDGPFDVILVTVGAWDIPPAWIAQLAPGGRLVVPLRMRGLTRSVAFVREGDHLVSESARVCGFVAMQGDGAHQEQLLLVSGTDEIGLRFDDGPPAEPSRLDNAVRTPPDGDRHRGAGGSSGAV